MKNCKEKLKPKKTGEYLYKEIFIQTSKGIIDTLNEEYNASIDETEENILLLECYTFTSFLITFSFQNKFKMIGNKKCNNILDIYHKILTRKTNARIKNKYDLGYFIDIRYPEYYQAMKLDIKKSSLPSTILFKNITDTFFNKIAKKNKFTAKKLLFGLFISECRIILDDKYNEIL